MLLYIWPVTQAFVVQGRKVSDLGNVDLDEEVKKRFKMIYIPNWFSVDLKIGVSLL